MMILMSRDRGTETVKETSESGKSGSNKKYFEILCNYLVSIQKRERL